VVLGFGISSGGKRKAFFASGCVFGVTGPRLILSNKYEKKFTL
jgi:hypothetical protein